MAQAEEARVALNFSNADLEAVIKAVSDLTGRTFVVDPKVKGTVNMVSTRPVPRAAVYPALQAALRMIGATAIEQGGVVRVVTEADAKTQGVSVVSEGPRGAGLVTRVIPLQRESAVQLAPVIRPLVSPNNVVTAYAPSNTLIITDYADNLAKLETLVNSLDRVETAEPALFTLKHAMAGDVVAILTRIVADPATGTANADPRDRVSIAADGRTNSIIVRSDNPARVERVRALIGQLDQPPPATRPIQLIHLKNAEAVQVAQTLRRVLQGEGGASAPLATTTSLVPPATQTQPTGAPNSANLSSAFGLATPTPTAAPTSFSAGGATISADPAQNAIIISAPEPIMRSLLPIVAELDVRRAQVFVEALIVELSADKAAEFGLQWQALSGLNNGDIRFVGGTSVVNPAAVGAQSNSALQLAAGVAASGRGLNLGIVRELVIPGVGTVFNLAGLAKALEKVANANVLSIPTLLTLDNEEAKIASGQNVPFITGQYTASSTGNSATPFQTIERKDVGLTLKVKPQISEGGVIKLNIYQEVSNIIEASLSNPAGIITNKRALESTVLVDDGRIVVLGGLMQDSLVDGEDKVPVLGSIPVVGSLFKYENRKRSKSNLMVFLRPVILRTAAQAQTLAQDRYQRMLGQQNDSGATPSWFWPDDTKPLLPAVPEVPGK